MSPFRLSLTPGTTLAIIFLSFAPISGFSMSFKSCKLEAKTPLENTYCDILEKGDSHSLPGFFDFRRNSEQTQRLLLTTPARRAGVALPAQTLRKPTFSNSAKTEAPKASAPSYGNDRELRGTNSNSDSSRDSDIGNTENGGLSLSGCELNADKISCPQISYFLTINIPLRRLDMRALSDDNTLFFREKSDGESALQYLSSLYPYYVEKMLLIGLGDSTLSFTKFNAIYQESLKQEENFTQRFSSMYELLKKERQSMAIKRRYRNNFPENLSQCMQLSSKLIACDNIEQNWIYHSANP